MLSYLALIVSDVRHLFLLSSPTFAVLAYYLYATPCFHDVL